MGGDYGAAVKNCIECGWAPGRDAHGIWAGLEGPCTNRTDGDFPCCFTGSRCPVNNPKDHSTKAYRLRYHLNWTRDMSISKPLKLVMIDTFGNIEQTIKPNYISERRHTFCDETICNTTRSVTVGDVRGMGSGICPGTMYWSYLHQHEGAINGTLFVNGRAHCSSTPVFGTDPNNTPGNEKDYIVGFENCVDGTKDNSMRLNRGDVVTVTGLYNVNSSSKFGMFPNGKHGGVMGLFFAYMQCDPGTFSEMYVCRQKTCVAAYDDDWKARVGHRDISKHYSTVEECQQSCH